MDRSVSWWDCGEFITTGYGLQVGHPPGAPVYQLITHCFMLLSFGNPLWVAPLSNFVSVLCASFTVLILYKTLRLLLTLLHSTHTTLPSVIGALCYLFCDTAWFSAVESEVYSMAMLFCALTVWLMLRWEHSGDHRLLLLVGMLLGLGAGVHFLTLLTLPALLWIFIRTLRTYKPPKLLKPLLLATALFLLGLSAYTVIPIRAAANPPINQIGDSFASYLKRDQYPKAPLYPRLWRERDACHWTDWCNGDSHSLWDNTVYYTSYQLGYMYCRYLMYNFIGRENFKIFILPFLLGLWGFLTLWRRRRSDFIMVALLFLFGGIILNLYLNHPCYEPRERDYAYVLSFYAFAIWIGVGTANIVSSVENHLPETHRRRKFLILNSKFLIFLAPLLLAVGNWSDHDRSHCHSVHDIAMNHLQSCDHGALLFTYGDNDTFPLWYLQQVERQRTDITMYNINLVGYRRLFTLLDDNAYHRPVYFSQYAYDRLKDFFPGRLRCEGFCWRLLPTTEGADDTAPLRRHIADSIRWNILPDEYLPKPSPSLLRIWKENSNINSLGEK